MEWSISRVEASYLAIHFLRQVYKNCFFFFFFVVVTFDLSRLHIALQKL